jgi:hypothetical protein
MKLTDAIHDATVLGCNGGSLTRPGTYSAFADHHWL